MHDKAEAFRARVLAAELTRFRGSSPRPLGPPGVELDYGPREARFAAEVLGPGPARAQAALHALGDPDDPRGTGRRELALEVAYQEYAAHRLEGALALGEALSKDLGDVESALLWLRSASLAGRVEDARREVAAREQGAPVAAAIEFDLLDAQLALAREEPGAARRALGRALALGSSRALVEIAWLELEERRSAAAARWLAGELDASAAQGREPRRRAWIGFALAQLPPQSADSSPDAPPAVRPPGGETRP
ncbi:MAG: hypothetical protein IPJ19_02005 [Planctomycetes bacterium]|nr:hypothetical protein [Planctomycetota bacterium]